ncbi:MAG: vWA domain-containing protein [Saprospiraceae bacterium]
MKLLVYSFLFALAFLFACSDDSASPAPAGEAGGFSGSGFTNLGDVASGGWGGTGTSSPGTPSPDTLSGLITAGEWNDLENWDYWTNLLTRSQEETDFGELVTDWTWNTADRIAIDVRTADGRFAPNVRVRLIRGQQVQWTTLTDNRGRAELWLNSRGGNAAIGDTYLDINEGEAQLSAPQRFEQGVNQYQLSDASEFAAVSNLAQIAFVVDATGSMGDEIEFLKSDLRAVMEEIAAANSSINFRTGAVFYRDNGDEYLTRQSPLTADLNTTVGFIQNQRAGGGGDFPEAVEVGLNEAINGFEWSSAAKTRIVFLLLDAPPHSDAGTIDNYAAAIVQAAAKGIRVIPVTASGIDKPTEFLMRVSALLTNGTYVFITDDSGIGNEHLEPTVGDFEVEFLKDLMVRLVGEYVGE